MNERQSIYDSLEEKMLNYTDYAAVPCDAIDEPFAPIPLTQSLTANAVRADMTPYTGERIYVRSTVLEKLQEAAAWLTDYDSGLTLEVGYGYRALEVQQSRFEEQRQRLSEFYEGEELLSRAHKYVAVPEVAGHPAGAAVDIQITQEGDALDFGTKLWEFQPDSFTFSPFITKEAWRNRQLLRSAMTNAGFAPFDGEWWHFSYGDKEWAKYYNMPAARYNQVDFRALD